MAQHGSSSLAKNGVSQHASKKGWTEAEDKKLEDYVQEHGEGNWNLIPQKIGVTRSGSSCRSRWVNFLRPDLKKGPFSVIEEGRIVELYRRLGNKWASIVAQVPGRTDSEIKNYCNTMKKRQKRARLATSPPEDPQQPQTFSSLWVSVQPHHADTSSFFNTVGSPTQNDPSPSILGSSSFNNQLTDLRDNTGGVALSLFPPNRSFSLSSPATAPVSSQSLSSVSPMPSAVDSFPHLGVTNVVSSELPSIQQLEAGATRRDDYMVTESVSMSGDLSGVWNRVEQVGLEK